jgi:AcrR family transcriptional regulator
MAGGEAAAATTAGRRSSRERILTAATTLFYLRGIHATGIDELAEVASVSKRTLYTLFGSKDQLVAAYLDRMTHRQVPNERALARTDLPPRERLLGLFERPTGVAMRGCPFHNAAVELPQPAHPAHPVIRAHKEVILRRLIDIAREAGAHDPDALGNQLRVLFDGATALATTNGDTGSFDHARTAAAILIDQAVGPADGYGEPADGYGAPAAWRPSHDQRGTVSSGGTRESRGE